MPRFLQPRTGSLITRRRLLQAAKGLNVLMATMMCMMSILSRIENGEKSGVDPRFCISLATLIAMNLVINIKSRDRLLQFVADISVLISNFYFNRFLPPDVAVVDKYLLLLAGCLLCGIELSTVVTIHTDRELIGVDLEQDGYSSNSDDEVESDRAPIGISS